MSPKLLTIEDIQEQCESLSNEQLLLVVNNKQWYTEKIVRVAYQEIRKRGLSKQEVKEIEKVHSQRSKIITGNIHEDILFWEKLGFFVLCVPKLHFLVYRNYRRKGYVLKVWQAGYFNLLGLLFFLLSVFLGSTLHSILTGGAIWTGGFLLVYFSNEYYFKGRIIKYLTARSIDPEDH